MLLVKRQRLQKLLQPQQHRQLKQPPRLLSKLHQRLFQMLYHLQHLSQQHRLQHLNRRRLRHRNPWRHQQLKNPLQHQFRYNQLLSKLQFNHNHPHQPGHDQLPLHNKSLLWINQNHQMLNSNHLEDHQV